MGRARIATALRKGLVAAAGFALGISMGALLGLGCPKNGQLQRSEKIVEAAEAAINRAIEVMDKVDQHERQAD